MRLPRGHSKRVERPHMRAVARRALSRGQGVQRHTLRDPERCALLAAMTRYLILFAAAVLLAGCTRSADDRNLRHRRSKHRPTATAQLAMSCPATLGRRPRVAARSLPLLQAATSRPSQRSSTAAPRSTSAASTAKRRSGKPPTSATPRSSPPCSLRAPTPTPPMCRGTHRSWPRWSTATWTCARSC